MVRYVVEGTVVACTTSCCTELVVSEEMVGVFVMVVNFTVGVVVVVVVVEVVL